MTITEKVTAETGKAFVLALALILAMVVMMLAAATPLQAQQGRYVVGTQFEDSLVGGNGPDLIEALGGDDALYGLPGDDALYGYFGNDALHGGFGFDALYGFDGNYFLDSSGAGVFEDVVSGGPGYDICVVGREDLRFTSGCEEVYIGD